MTPRTPKKSQPQASGRPGDTEAGEKLEVVEELDLNFETEAKPAPEEEIHVVPEGAAVPEPEGEAMPVSSLSARTAPGPLEGVMSQVKVFLEQPAHGRALAVAVAAGLVVMIWIYGQIPGPPPPPDKTAELALQTGLSQAKAGLEDQQRSLKELAGQLAVLTQELKQEREHTQARFQEVSGRLAETIRQKLAAPVSATPAMPASQVIPAPGGAVQPTAAVSELLLLKERNRLTDYADKAIATGSRDSLQAVVEAMFDPERQSLHHAAQAEFRRVQAFYEISASIDPDYKLPLLELFKDGSVKAEADVRPVQLMTLMKDAGQPWEVRLRCAYLLRENPDKSVNAALLQALKEDASLDVAKQAQTSLERRLAKRFRLFDIPAVEAWMQAHPQN